MLKQQYLWTLCQSVVPNDAPRDFGPEVAFGAKFQIPVARQGGREVSAPRPYVTDPFRLLSSVTIYIAIPIYTRAFKFFPACGTFKCVLRWDIFNDCACALLETLLIVVQSFNKSCVFPYGTRWCILAQNR